MRNKKTRGLDVKAELRIRSWSLEHCLVLVTATTKICVFDRSLVSATPKECCASASEVLVPRAIKDLEVYLASWGASRTKQMCRRLNQELNVLVQ